MSGIFAVISMRSVCGSLRVACNLRVILAAARSTGAQIGDPEVLELAWIAAVCAVVSSQHINHRQQLRLSRERNCVAVET